MHLGVGNFHRAHQAWYTARASDAEGWGIAAFTGRSSRVADALAPQDGLYTLVIRSAAGDTFEVVGSLVEVHAAAGHDRLLDLLSRPEVGLVTITVTERGYVLDADGHLDVADEVVGADVAALRDDARAVVASMPARLVAGLQARRDAGTGAITVLSCDNLPDNGSLTRAVVVGFADLVDETLARWIDENVEFATSMVDRITPATTDDDRRLVEQTQGYIDADPVPTEPFSEWVVSGAFPAGRPRWESAGATLVDDVTPFEQRKLWLLNGSHSLLAYAGSVRGHETIDEAVADPACRAWVEQLWDEACRHLTVGSRAICRQRCGPDWGDDTLLETNGFSLPCRIPRSSSGCGCSIAYRTTGRPVRGPSYENGALSASDGFRHSIGVSADVRSIQRVGSSGATPHAVGFG